MKSNLLNILKKELRELFRDKKSLAMMLVIPFMIPLIILGMSALFDSTENRPIEDYNVIGFNYNFNDIENEIAKNIQINPVHATNSELVEMYEEGSIDLYVIKSGNSYEINGVDNETTAYASMLAESFLGSYKEYLQQNNLALQGIDPTSIIEIISVERNIVETENFFVTYITIYSFLFIIMAITVSATYPATDTTAGEKERGTLETLLTFPIKSRDIILGKFLSVSISSIITGLLSLVLTLISLVLANNLFSIYEGENLMLSSEALIYSVIVIILFSLLISGLCIAIASKAKSFKEAQSALTPITFISFFPGMIAFNTSITTNLALSLVPFLNYTLIFTDIVYGDINIVHIVMMILSTLVFLIIVLAIIIRQYKSEKVLFTS